MTNKYFFFLFFFSFFVSGAAAQHVSENGKHQKLIHTIESILQSQVNRKLIPGAVVEIKKGNEILCRKAFGFAERNDYQNKPLAHPEKMTPGDLFDLASLTKVVGTTTAIMLLVDRGQIHVDDPVSKYIPAFGSGDKKQITIRNLLTHTAGLITWYPLFYRASNKQEAYQLIGELPLAFPVGK